MNPMTGRTIGNYRLISKLGEGGMGKVYRAIDVMVQREVALKSLKPEIAAQPGVLDRFRSEAVILAKLNHPAIAQLYTFFKEGDDFYMVMEYVAGETLAEVIKKEGALGWQRACSIAVQILEGIGHAHDLGILHRDLKPANVMLTAAGKVKLMDFGIAQALGAARMTREGRIIGTLEYLAPERIQGKPASVRSDLYSVGVLLYEMVTGRLPFEADSEYELLLAHVQKQVPPPRELGISLPEAVEQAIMQALEKDPARRYACAADFAARLATLVPAEPKATRLVEAAPAASTPPHSRSNRKIAAISAAALLVVVAAVVALAHLLYKPPIKKQVAAQTALPPAQMTPEPPQQPAPAPLVVDSTPITLPQPAPKPPAAAPVHKLAHKKQPAPRPSTPPAGTTAPPPQPAAPAPAPPPAPVAVAEAPKPAPAAPPPPAPKTAPARRIVTLADVHVLYVEAENGLAGYIRDEIRKQLGARFGVATSPAGADAVMRVTLEQPKGGTISRAGRFFGIKDRSEVHAVIEVPASNQVLWQEGAGDKKPIVGAFHGDSLKRLAEKIVKELRGAP